METFVGKIFQFPLSELKENNRADTIIYGQWLWAAENTPGSCRWAQGFRYTKKSQADVTSDFAIFGN